MNLRKVFAFCFLSILTLVSVVFINNADALDVGKVYSDRQHIKNLDLNNDGLVVFRWRYKDDNDEDRTVCFWVVLDENTLRNKFKLNDWQLRFFKENEFKIVDTQILSFGISTEAAAYLTSCENRFLGIEHHCLLLKNWIDKKELGDSLVISGVNIYYHKSRWFGTWYGYQIVDTAKFKSWCELRELTDDEIKILVACQNTWMRTKTLNKSFAVDTPDLLPKKFRDSLYATRAKFKACGHVAEGELKNFIIPVSEVSIGSAIDNSDVARMRIGNQLHSLKVPSDVVDSILSSDDTFSHLKSPVSCKIRCLKMGKCVA